MTTVDLRGVSISPTIYSARQAAKKVAHFLLWPLRALEARRTLGQLGAMSDCELADLGLCRSDVANAAAGPADADPGLALNKVRAERKAARDLAYTPSGPRKLESHAGLWWRP